MRERYDLNKMLKEIESESIISTCQKKNQKSNQEDISKLFSKKKLGSSALGKPKQTANKPNKAEEQDEK